MHSDNQLIRKVKKKNDREAADELLGRFILLSGSRYGTGNWPWI